MGDVVVGVVFRKNVGGLQVRGAGNRAIRVSLAIEFVVGPGGNLVLGVAFFREVALGVVGRESGDQGAVAMALVFYSPLLNFAKDNPSYRLPSMTII